MKLTHIERLRRAAKKAKHKADVAHTAIWQARKAFDEVEAVAKDMLDGSLTPTIRSFVDAEVTRQRAQSADAENSYYHVMCDIGDLCKLLGADK